MESQNPEFFIWTEAYNCGELLNPFLESYLYHHKNKIHIFATDEDFKYLKFNSPLISRGVFSKISFINQIIEKRVISKYKKGHAGTAYLWSKIIRKNKDLNLIHIDADTIFVGESLHKLMTEIMNGVSLAGSRRVYRNRTYRLTGRSSKSLNKLPDVVNTDLIAFKADKIRKFPQWWLRRKISGRRPIKHPCIDFFDPISFELLSKGALIAYLDSPLGGRSSYPNNESEFVKNRISFAAVGSGINFSKRLPKKVNKNYIDFALSSYRLYSKFILNKDIGGPCVEDPELINKLQNLDKSIWKLN